MLPDEKTGCHRTGFAKTCRQCVIEHGCQLWDFVAGTDPNTGDKLNRYMCLDKLNKHLQIESLQHLNEVGAEIHELRNDIAAARGESARIPSASRWAPAPKPEHKRLG